MSDEGRGRGEAVWLKGEVCLEYLSFVYVPDGNYMYFMFICLGEKIGSGHRQERILGRCNGPTRLE